MTTTATTAIDGRRYNGKHLAKYQRGRKAVNLEAVRTYFEAHLCATQIECAKALGITTITVGKHVKTIRQDWQPALAANAPPNTLKETTTDTLKG